MTAEVVVVVQEQDARVIAGLLAEEVRGSEPTDAAAYYHQIVRFTRVSDGTGLLPLLQPAPAGVARPVSELLRQMHPRDPRVQHEQDPLQRLPIRVLRPRPPRGCREGLR